MCWCVVVSDDAVAYSTSSAVQCMQSLHQCACEDEDALTGDSCSSCVSAMSVMKQRKLHSSALLKKEQKQSSPGPDVFIKVFLFIIV